MTMLRSAGKEYRQQRTLISAVAVESACASVALRPPSRFDRKLPQMPAKRKRAPDTRRPYHERSGKVQHRQHYEVADLDLIKRAAVLAGVSASKFVINAAVSAAKLVVERDGH